MARTAGTGEFVHVETDQAVAAIRLDRPPMNALNGQVQDEIAVAAARVAAADGVRAVVIYGSEKVFAAGADVNEPSLALRAAKQAIDDGLGVDLATGLEIERLNFAGLFATEDQRTAMRSFIENGPGKATFAGR